MVRLRLTRMGRKKRPYYRIIAVDKRNRRDGACIERLGYYHPLNDPFTVSIDGEKALKWLRLGAIPSDTVRSLLRKEGIWYRFLLEKRKLPENQIEEMMSEWFAKHSKSSDTVKDVVQESLTSSDVSSVDTEPKPAGEEGTSKEAKPEEKPVAKVAEPPKTETKAESTPEPARADVISKEAKPEEKPVVKVADSPKTEIKTEPTPEPARADVISKEAKPEEKPVVKVADSPKTEIKTEPTPEPAGADVISKEAKPEDKPVVKVADSPKTEIKADSTPKAEKEIKPDNPPDKE
ncbi:30S ribosomal protein S16 [bacterium]|nr:30S ribosomal protein S16 [bacterium]